MAPEEDDLAVDDEREITRARQSDGGPEAIPVDRGVDERGGKYRENLKGLRELEPEKRHESEDGVVEELGEGEPTTSYDSEEGAEHVQEAGEVEDVGPEEDPTGGAGPEGEAEEPLEGGLGAPPEPAGVADLCGSGEEDSDEDGGGDEGHREAVEGGEGAEVEGSGAEEADGGRE